MPRHPLAKIASLISTLKVIRRYATHKEPETLEEAKKMLRLIATISEETIKEEADSPTSVYVA